MKNKHIIPIVTLCLVIFTLLAVGACDKTENMPEHYPIEIPFTEYSLESTSCQWTGLAYDTVVTINSMEELNQYVTCMGGSYPEIDFSKYTLLLAHGKAPSSVVNVSCSSLQQLLEQSYKMEVEIVVGDAAVISNWQVPIIINRLDERCTIELIVALK